MQSGKIDIVIVQVGKSSGYIATNRDVFKIFPIGDIRSCVLDIKRNFKDYVYTFESIIPAGDNERDFRYLDYIYKNKIRHRLDSLIERNRCLQR